MVFFQLSTVGLISLLSLAIETNHKPFVSAETRRITFPFSCFLCSLSAQPKSSLNCRYSQHLA